jgi:hypothetical protein
VAEVGLCRSKLFARTREGEVWHRKIPTGRWEPLNGGAVWRGLSRPPGQARVLLLEEDGTVTAVSCELTRQRIADGPSGASALAASGNHLWFVVRSLKSERINLVRVSPQGGDTRRLEVSLSLSEEERARLGAMSALERSLFTRVQLVAGRSRVYAFFPFRNVLLSCGSEGCKENRWKSPRSLIANDLVGLEGRFRRLPSFHFKSAVELKEGRLAVLPGISALDRSTESLRQRDRVMLINVGGETLALSDSMARSVGLVSDDDGRVLALGSDDVLRAVGFDN